LKELLRQGEDYLHAMVQSIVQATLEVYEACMYRTE
jgi:hypothetical protein